jgi:hypothetical protein
MIFLPFLHKQEPPDPRITLTIICESLFTFCEVPRGPWSTLGENNTFVINDRKKTVKPEYGLRRK